MRSIGLLGGTSWPSTVLYYRLLNSLIQQKLGEHHSAELILLSIDNHDFKSRYHHAWAEIPGLLQTHLERLFRLGPDCVLICNNTLHRALDLLGDTLRPPVPIFHLIELTAAHAADRKLRRVLLLGTRFTMEDGYYHRHLGRYGLQVEVPSEADRYRIQQAQVEMSQGRLLPVHRQVLADVIRKHRHADGVILGCTELPLAVDPNEHEQLIIDPVTVHCHRAVEFALGESSDAPREAHELGLRGEKSDA